MPTGEPNERFVFVAPWIRVDEDARDLEEELRKEVPPGHILHGSVARAIARRNDSDDVLFKIELPNTRYAVVHLTWTGAPEPDPQLPYAEVFDTFQDWNERGREKL
jgi:hypothetical protein